MGVRLTHIPGTMSLESVGVLKLQACSGQLISGAGQTPLQNANGCTVGFGPQERPKHWRCLWYRVWNRAERLGRGVHLWT
jgi:hypothetical protein